MAQQYRFEITDSGPQLVTLEQQLGVVGDADVVIEVEAAAISPLEVSTGLGPSVALGASAIGVVSSAGSAATAFVGQRVLAPAIQPCGECDSCRRAVPSGCSDALVLGDGDCGAVADKLISRARWLITLTGKLEGLETKAAILGGDGLRAYTAYCRAGVAPGEPVVVLGEGTASDVLAEIGASMGAKISRAANASELKAVLGTNSISQAKPWCVFALDRFIGADGITISEVIPHGSTLVVGNPNAISELGIVAMCERGVTVIGQRWGHPDLLGELAALVAKGDLKLSYAAESIPASDLTALHLVANASEGRTTVATFSK